MMGLDPTAVVRILSSSARGLGTRAAFIQIPPLLLTPTTHPSASKTVNQKLRGSVLPWSFSLRLIPAQINLHSVGTAASLN